MSLSSPLASTWPSTYRDARMASSAHRPEPCRAAPAQSRPVRGGAQRLRGIPRHHERVVGGAVVEGRSHVRSSWLIDALVGWPEVPAPGLLPRVDRRCWANRRAYSAAAGGTAMSSREIPSMSMSTTAPRFEAEPATISRCKSWSWRNSGMMSMKHHGHFRSQVRKPRPDAACDLSGDHRDADGHNWSPLPFVMPA
jgi:hypothetical protein